MSTDLYVEHTKPIPLQLLLPEIGKVLAGILGLAGNPEFLVYELENGQRQIASDDELRDGAYFLLTIKAEPETVGLAVRQNQITMIMGAQRTDLEYVLGAATAIVLAREFGEVIGMTGDSLVMS